MLKLRFNNVLTYSMVNFLRSKCPSRLFALLLLLSPATQAATWFVLEAPGSVSAVTIEVDLESLRSRGEKRDVITRITYPVLQRKQDLSFQSVIAELEISCNSDLDIWKSVSFFAGSTEGKPLSSENYGTVGVSRSVLKLLPEKAWTTLQRSACGRTSTLAP